MRTMALSPASLNKFLILKLPSAWLCGVRVRRLDEKSCITTVRYRWINQNPFRSMYFAVQAMAAELSTGALCISQIKTSGLNISMLVAESHSYYTKKAVGRITFTCSDGEKLQQALKEATRNPDGVICILTSVGTDETGAVVSRMDFHWTFRQRAPKGNI